MNKLFDYSVSAILLIAIALTVLYCIVMLFYFFKSCKTIFSTNRWDYSPYTEAGVKAYQKRHGLVQDGWAGCITTKYMKLECADHNCDKSAPAPDSKVDSSYLQLAGTVNQTMKNHRFS